MPSNKENYIFQENKFATSFWAAVDLPISITALTPASKNTHRFTSDEKENRTNSVNNQLFINICAAGSREQLPNPHLLLIYYSAPLFLSLYLSCFAIRRFFVLLKL